MTERHGRARTRTRRSRSTLVGAMLLAACLVACDASHDGTSDAASPPDTVAPAVGGEVPPIEDATVVDAAGGTDVARNGAEAADVEDRPTDADPVAGDAGAPPATASARGDGPGREGEEASAGHALFDANCAICHGAAGGGGVGPPLADNPNVQVTDYVVAQVLLGGGGMPPFAPRLADAEIAAVVTFVRTELDNHAGPVAAEQVGVQRRGLRPGIRLGPSAAAVDPFASVEERAAEDAADAPVEEASVDDTDDADGGGDAGGGAGATAPEGAEGLSLGERIYVQQGCSGCHGVEGGGGIGPALAGNEALEDAAFVIDRVLHGGGGMPAFAEGLNDEEIAAVASHERTSWGNDFGRVDAGRVAERRAASEEGP